MSDRVKPANRRLRRTGLLASISAALVSSVAACGGSEEGPHRASASATHESVLPAGAQARSMLGELLHPPELPAETLEQRRRDLEEAEAALSRRTDDADALIWVGRRLAYLGEYREAIERFGDGVEAFPEDPRFLRHRGHRYITVREFERAVTDFRRAVRLIEGRPDEVEPDGMPNHLGIPTSTLHFNIWYHYGLALYLLGDFEQALEAYRACLEASRHPDSVVATTHWLYMTLRRLGRSGEAEAVLEGIHPDMDIIESGAYLRLLLMYRGELSPDEVLVPEEEALQNLTVAYGVGNWYLYAGDPERATEIFRRIVNEKSQWAAFGYIAAEAELARMERP